MKQDSHLIITINRQLGSGGAYIGQLLAKRLNIFYADKAIISEASKQLGALGNELEYRDEKISSYWDSFLQSFSMGFPDAFAMPNYFAPTDNELFEIQTEIIKRIVHERSAVIIGRCGSYILRQHPNHVCVFLHSHFDFRKARIQDRFNVTEEEAEKMIEKIDNDRALYYHKFTGKDWNDFRQYDLTIDTGKIGVDKCVELILKYLE